MKDHDRRFRDLKCSEIIILQMSEQASPLEVDSSRKRAIKDKTNSTSIHSLSYNEFKYVSTPKTKNKYSGLWHLLNAMPI